MPSYRKGLTQLPHRNEVWKLLAITPLPPPPCTNESHLLPVIVKFIPLQVLCPAPIFTAYRHRPVSILCGSDSSRDKGAADSCRDQLIARPDGLKNSDMQASPGKHC